MPKTKQKYYWVLYTWNGGAFAHKVEKAIKVHPFEFLNYDVPNSPVLLNWKEITLDEYHLFLNRVIT